MPYSTPTSPIPSPVKETVPVASSSSTSHGGHNTWLNHYYDQDPYHDRRSVLHQPMTIPKRSPSASRFSAGKIKSPATSRSSSYNNGSLPTETNAEAGPSTPSTSTLKIEGLPPRRGSPAPPGALATSHEPSTPDRPPDHNLRKNGESSSLGLRLHPSPDKSAPSMTRNLKDSMDSTSTIESALPPTPSDEHQDLPLPPIDAAGPPNKPKDYSPSKVTDQESSAASIPFPPFEPPAHRSIHLSSGRSFSDTPSRPAFLTRRGSASGHTRGGNGIHPASMSIDLPASASTSTLDVPQRPSSMIRKKSGEVVKPSLKIRSMSTPDLTRLNGETDVNPHDDAGRQFGDERSKSVRFAGDDDDHPGTLENVVTFLKEGRPEQLGQEPMTETETENDTDASDFVQFRTRRNAAARAIDEAERISLEGGSRVPRIRVDFAPDARGALKDENVVLERVDMVTPGPLALKGTAVVRNLAFSKWVAVRFTLDHWQTVSEVSGNHVCHIPASTTGDEGWDRFAFSIKLDDYKRKLEERQLILCVRFSANGREWWDSNNGINYNFTFKKAPARRPLRNSTPPALGANFATGLHVARQKVSSPLGTGADMNRAFGVPASSQHSKGPRDWVFPRLAASHITDVPPRSASPALSPPPAASFKAPGPPDVHSHLSLSKRYCAPSPPSLSPKVETTTSPIAVESMDIMGGQPATLQGVPSEHERSASWSGSKTGSWESFSKVVEQLDTKGAPGAPTSEPMDSSFSSAESTSTDSTERGGTSRLASDGESTPVAGSRSPINLPTDSEGSSGSSPAHRPLTMKRSTGDLRALLTAANQGRDDEHDAETETETEHEHDQADEQSLSTPSSSNLSSPPSPRLNLPVSMGLSSPSPSASTGDSSPVNTVSTNDSVTDLTNLSIHVDPMDRGRSDALKDLSGDRYREFLEKFCFFRSPGQTPVDEQPLPRPTYLPLSGSASPNGFPFFTSSSSSSHSSQSHDSHSSHRAEIDQTPRSTPTPTQTYKSETDAFRLVPAISAHDTPQSRHAAWHEQAQAHSRGSYHSPSHSRSSTSSRTSTDSEMDHLESQRGRQLTPRPVHGYGTGTGSGSGSGTEAGGNGSHLSGTGNLTPKASPTKHGVIHAGGITLGNPIPMRDMNVNLTTAGAGVGWPSQEGYGAVSPGITSN